jgi:hypothetical protein
MPKIAGNVMFGAKLTSGGSWCMSGMPQGMGLGNGYRRPLPTNPAFGFPATGSPVGRFLIGVGALIEGFRTT